MSTIIKAIETRYKNYRFRSRLEARWAVFFDAMSELWDYEPEGFAVGGGYLPDFWLPRFGVFVEVKPGPEVPLASDAINKAEELAWHHKPVVILQGLGSLAAGDDASSDKITLFCNYETNGSIGCAVVDAYWVVGDDQQLLLCAGARNNSWGDWCDGSFAPVPRIVFAPTGSPLHPALRQAYAAARSARFEHGESGVNQ